jgi:putative ABC transport system ATP-binding protein
MGPSGSGKSTLMTILGLLDVPTSGSYWLDGQDVSKLDRVQQARVRNQKLGFVFQNFNLLPRLTALKNVELPLVYGRVGAREREERARRALEAVGLETKLHNRPNELSGGQKQRVAIARALVGNPAMVLADEPTGALDTRTGAEIMALFRELNREQGITIVIVTHDPEIGKQMDRVIGLRDGRIADNILQEYYHVNLAPEELELPVREMAPVPVPVLKAEQE